MKSVKDQTKKLDDLPDELPPALGFGKEPPYTFDVIKITGADHLQNVLNQAPAYAHFYWAALSAGYLVVAIPNPKAREQREAPRIEQGVKIFSESEAIAATKGLFTSEIDSQWQKDLAFIVTRLYDLDFKIGIKVETTK